MGSRTCRRKNASLGLSVSIRIKCLLLYYFLSGADPSATQLCTSRSTRMALSVRTGLIMRTLQLAALAICTMLFSASALAQDVCPFGFGGEKNFDALAKSLSNAKSCQEAVRTLHACMWGSSADTQFSAIVVENCEKAFFPKLSKAAQANYEEEMQLCAYEYAKAEGTMAMSAASLCQVDVAAGIAADPALASKPLPRASFDCTKARSSLEKAICSDMRLGHADIVLGRVYKGVLRSLKGQSATDLVDSEKKWLAQVVLNCHANQARLNPAEKNCVAVEFENRFTDLDSCEDAEEDQSMTACLAESAAEREQELNGESQGRSRASFNCEKPKSALEIAICADAFLGQEDIDVADSYRKSLALLPSRERPKLIGSQKQWLKYVQSVCPMGVVGGIPDILTRSCIRTAFQTRNTQFEECGQKPEAERANCLDTFRLFPTD